MSWSERERRNPEAELRGFYLRGASVLLRHRQARSVCAHEQQRDQATCHRRGDENHAKGEVIFGHAVQDCAADEAAADARAPLTIFWRSVA